MVYNFWKWLKRANGLAVFAVAFVPCFPLAFGMFLYDLIGPWPIVASGAWFTFLLLSKYWFDAVCEFERETAEKAERIARSRQFE